MASKSDKYRERHGLNNAPEERNVSRRQGHQQAQRDSDSSDGESTHRSSTRNRSAGPRDPHAPRTQPADSLNREPRESVEGERAAPRLLEAGSRYALFPGTGNRQASRPGERPGDDHETERPNYAEQLISRSDFSRGVREWRAYIETHPNVLADTTDEQYFIDEAISCLRNGDATRARNCMRIVAMFRLVGGKSAKRHRDFVDDISEDKEEVVALFKKTFQGVGTYCQQRVVAGGSVRSDPKKIPGAKPVEQTVAGRVKPGTQSGRHDDDSAKYLATSAPLPQLYGKVRTMSMGQSAAKPAIAANYGSKQGGRHDKDSDSTPGYNQAQIPSATRPRPGNQPAAQGRARYDNKNTPDINGPDDQDEKPLSITGPKESAGQFEQLDVRYQRREGKKAGRFFSIGRVFAILTHSDNTTTDDSATAPNWTRDILLKSPPTKTRIFSHINRFVVVREGHGFCWAIPIHTYNNQGCCKRGLNQRDIFAHAIIYSTRDPPDPLPGEPGMTKQPIAIDLSSSAEDKDRLKRSSRINFSQVTTVQHNVRALDIGNIRNTSKARFEQYWRSELLQT